MKRKVNVLIVMATILSVGAVGAVTVNPGKLFDIGKESVGFVKSTITNFQNSKNQIELIKNEADSNQKIILGLQLIDTNGEIFERLGKVLEAIKDADIGKKEDLETAINVTKSINTIINTLQKEITDLITKQQEIKEKLKKAQQQKEEDETLAAIAGLFKED